MEKRVVIKPKKERDCTFSIRIDREIQNAYEELSSITGYSRNELINKAMRHFLEHIDIDTADDKTKIRIAEFQVKYVTKNTIEY